MSELLFIIVLFLSNAIQGITGFAGTLLAMPAASYLVGLTNAKVILNVMALLSCAMIAWNSRQDILWKEVRKISFFMFIGVGVGLVIYDWVPSEDMLLQILGVVIVAVALKNILVKKEMNLSQPALIAVLFGAGIIQGMFVSGGALLVIYAVIVLKEKKHFRATLAMVWTVLDTFLVFTQWQQGLFNETNLWYITISIIPLFIATAVGAKLAKTMDQKVFLNITYALLLVSGIFLIF